MKTDCVIIGAGPSGLMAAIIAARCGKKAVVLEKNRIAGAKILASGGGRCNISNSTVSPACFNSNPEFAVKVISEFTSKELLSFFEGLGVYFKEEALGRIIPATEQAVTVLDAVLLECAALGVEIKCSEEAVSVKKEGEAFTVKTGKAVYSSSSLVIAGGGIGYKLLGNSQKGAALAAGFGHKIVPQRPALVPLKLSGSFFHRMQGVKQEAAITVRTPAFERTYPGDLLFTSYGISGPCAMDASSLGTLPGSECFINFLPGRKDTAADLVKLLKTRPKMSIASALSGLINKKGVKALLSELKINPDGTSKDVSAEEIKSICKKLYNWKIEVTGPKSFDDAMVTAGGVEVSEVNPLTMESKKTRGLYIAGELLDVDGISGGYNMQFAFSSGYVAGKSLD